MGIIFIVYATSPSHSQSYGRTVMTQKVHVCKILMGFEKTKVDKIMSVLQNENNIISNLLLSLVYG